MGTLHMAHMMLGVFALYMAAMLAVMMRAAPLEALAFLVLLFRLRRSLSIVLMLVLFGFAAKRTLPFAALLVCHRIAPLPSVS